jgi:hypothetical protein
MSGKPPPQPPLLGPAQAQTLLDQVIYEQVLECIDLDALCRLEQSSSSVMASAANSSTIRGTSFAPLAMMAGELEGVGPDKAGDMATAMLDRALLRLPADVRSYLRLAGLLSSASGCALCDEETRPGAPAPARPSPVRPRADRGAGDEAGRA